MVFDLSLGLKFLHRLFSIQAVAAIDTYVSEFLLLCSSSKKFNMIFVFQQFIQSVLAHKVGYSWVLDYYIPFENIA